MFEQSFLYFCSCRLYLVLSLGTTATSLVLLSYLSPITVKYLYQVLEQDKVLVLPLKTVTSDLLPWARIYKEHTVNCDLDFGSEWALLSLPTFGLVNLLFPFLPHFICLWSLPIWESKCYTAQTKLRQNEYCLKLQYSGV